MLNNLLGLSKFKKNAYGFFAAKNPAFGPIDKETLRKYSEASAFIIKGILKHLDSDFDGSCLDFRKASLINPRDKTFSYLLALSGRILAARNVSEGNDCLDGGLYEKALVCFNKALALDPASSEALEGLGIVYMKKGAFLKAIDSFKKSASVKPGNFNPHYFLSMLHARAGNKKEALKELKTALELNHRDRKPYAQLERVFEKNGLGEDARKLLSCF